MAEYVCNLLRIKELEVINYFDGGLPCSRNGYRVTHDLGSGVPKICWSCAMKKRLHI